jgi:hypothetical protein
MAKEKYGDSSSKTQNSMMYLLKAENVKKMEASKPMYIPRTKMRPPASRQNGKHVAMLFQMTAAINERPKHF